MSYNIKIIIYDPRVCNFYDHIMISLVIIPGGNMSCNIKTITCHTVLCVMISYDTCTSGMANQPVLKWYMGCTGVAYM